MNIFFIKMESGLSFEVDFVADEFPTIIKNIIETILHGCYAYNIQPFTKMTISTKTEYDEYDMRGMNVTKLFGIKTPGGTRMRITFYFTPTNDNFILQGYLNTPTLVAGLPT